ncbi:hypothetical protein [Methanococcus sp. CF]
MIKLISDIIFLIAVLILLKTSYILFNFLIWHRAKIGVRTVIAIILYLIMGVSFILPLYSLFYLKILLPAVPVEYIKLQSAVIILASTLICRYITIRSKNALADYCLKKGIITK